MKNKYHFTTYANQLRNMIYKAKIAWQIANIESIINLEFKKMAMLQAGIDAARKEVDKLIKVCQIRRVELIAGI
jgi:hypothetical protein